MEAASTTGVEGGLQESLHHSGVAGPYHATTLCDCEQDSVLLYIARHVRVVQKSMFSVVHLLIIPPVTDPYAASAMDTYRYGYGYLQISIDRLCNTYGLGE